VKATWRRKAFGLGTLSFAMVPVCAALLTLVAVPGGQVRADDTVQVSQLVENMQKYDGREVTIVGEAIGDVMVRGTYAWITVNDDRYSKKSIEEGGELIGMSNSGMGVWVLERDTRDINIYGGYKNKGADVRVTGVFHRACHEHGGDTDIHATSLEVLKPGYPFSHRFPYYKLLAVLLLTCAIGLLWYWRSIKAKRHARQE
jgi:hypothetical protein